MVTTGDIVVSMVIVLHIDVAISRISDVGIVNLRFWDLEYLRIYSFKCTTNLLRRFNISKSALKRARENIMYIPVRDPLSLLAKMLTFRDVISVKN